MALGKAPRWPVSQRAVCFAYLKLFLHSQGFTVRPRDLVPAGLLLSTAVGMA